MGRVKYQRAVSLEMGNELHKVDFTSSIQAARITRFQKNNKAFRLKKPLLENDLAGAKNLRLSYKKLLFEPTTISTASLKLECVEDQVASFFEATSIHSSLKEAP